MPVHIVLGGQFGSEGKGEITAFLAKSLRPAAVVRVGGPNAGHTMTLCSSPGSWGNTPAVTGTFSFRQVPCGFHTPSVLIIGPGSLVDLPVLMQELRLISKQGWVGPLILDSQAIVITDDHKQREQDLKSAIGSTGKGIGAARAAHILRTPGILAGDLDPDDVYNEGSDPLIAIEDTVPIVNRLYDQGSLVLVESTQGFGLSLSLSSHYPFCTSRDITPAQALNDAGLAGVRNWDCTAVLRTFPIRVAGNSGPMFSELTWPELNQRIGHDVVPEKTTVTHLIRRIGIFDRQEVQRMGLVCRPTQIALTFLDYPFPRLSNCTDVSTILGHDGVLPLLSDVSAAAGAPVNIVSTGPGCVTTLASAPGSIDCWCGKDH